MRRSVLSRSVIAVASFVIGSAALAVVPANAADSSGITREQVLAATAGARSASPTEAQTSAKNAIVLAACGVVGGEYLFIPSEPLKAGDDADGLMMTVIVVGPGDEIHVCKAAAFATVDPTFELSGSATIDGIEEGSPGEDPPRTTLFTAPLSGDVFLTGPVEIVNMYDVTASAQGNATKTITVPTRTVVSTPKTTSQKKAAKKTYDNRLKSVKKAYKKAVKKAGSKSKKAKAKKTYAKRKASAKKAYRKAIANGSRIVEGTATSTEMRPFAVASRWPGN